MRMPRLLLCSLLIVQNCDSLGRRIMDLCSSSRGSEPGSHLEITLCAGQPKVVSQTVQVVHDYAFALLLDLFCSQLELAERQGILFTLRCDEHGRVSRKGLRCFW